jgi:hypothetical protein
MEADPSSCGPAGDQGEEVMIRRAVVLGAGGPAASSWETGVVAGLADEGIDVRNADLLAELTPCMRSCLQRGFER